MKQTPRPSNPKKPRNISEIQFKYFPPQGKDPMHTLTAVNEANPAHQLGTLIWHKKSGKVDWVRTHKDYRGLGLASTLWEKAHKLSADTGISAPKHSRDRTPEGDVWAKSVGGNVPPRSKYELP